MRMGAPITYLDIEEARKIEAREGHSLARTWEGWKQKVMSSSPAARQRVESADFFRIFRVLTRVNGNPRRSASVPDAGGARRSSRA